MSKPTIYVSIDIEADGPIPGPHSMLQFGAAAFDISRTNSYQPVSLFKANLFRLPEALQNPVTMAWWAKQGDAYENTRTNLQTPEVAMPRFLKWIKSLPGKPVLIGYPVTYDFMWIYWYTMRFGGLDVGERCPFGFQGLDLKTLAAEKLQIPFNQTSKERMPQEWFKDAPEHSHDALDDAIGQGIMFVNMMPH